MFTYNYTYKTMDFAEYEGNHARFTQCLQSLLDEKITGLDFKNLDKLGELEGPFLEWLDKHPQILHFRYPDEEENFKEAIKDKKNSWKRPRLEEYEGLCKTIKKGNIDEELRKYIEEYETLRDALIRNDLHKRYPVGLKIESILARNRFLAYHECASDSNDLWLEAVKIFSTRTTAGDFHSDHHIEFGWYRRLYQTKDATYVFSPEDRWVDQMGPRFMKGYFNYLNSSKSRYKNSPFPYKMFLFTPINNYVGRPSISEEKLSCLSGYLSNKDNFFPFVQIYFQLDTFYAEDLKTLIKSVDERQLEKVNYSLQQIYKRRVSGFT